MPKAKRYTSEQIEKARKKLRGLSTKKVGKSRAEVAALLAGEIRKAVAQGYSLKEIRDVLAQAGVSIPLARLQAVLDGKDEKEGFRQAVIMKVVWRPMRKVGLSLRRQGAFRKYPQRRIGMTNFEGYQLSSRISPLSELAVRANAR